MPVGNDGLEHLDFGRAAHDCAAVADSAVYFPNFVGINFMFNGDLDGPAWGGGTVADFVEAVDIPETRDYVELVLQWYARCEKAYAGSDPR